MLIRYILPYFFIFIATLYRPTDPDLGWHLKYGEYFFKHQRPLYENTFSTEMAGYVWPNISWGTDVISYALYSTGGFFVLSLAAALIIALTFFFFSRAAKLSYWDEALIFPLILFLLGPIHSDSFKGQLMSLLFFGVLFYLLNKYKRGKIKALYFIPFLFLSWANIHGLFLLGLGIFATWQGLFLLSENNLKKHLRIFIPLGILSFLATLAHPFGYSIYLDALAHFNNPLLKSIVEYLPAEELSPLWYSLFLTAILGGVGLTSYLLGKSMRKKLPETGIYGILFMLSLWVKRYAWVMFYTLIPLLKPVTRFLKPNSKKWVFRGSTILFTGYILILLPFKYPPTQYLDMNWETYCMEFSDCSPRAAEALKQDYIEGKTMTLYNWGGWLIWNYPDLKPSVDGRMHLWRDKKGYSAFEHDYYLEQNITDINDSKYEVVFTSKSKPIYERLKELENMNLWEMTYEDETSVIFVRS